MKTTRRELEEDSGMEREEMKNGRVRRERKAVAGEERRGHEEYSGRRGEKRT
jgi:hypothetical protein